MFDPVDPRQSFPELEKGILEYWRYENTFKRSIRLRLESFPLRPSGYEGQVGGQVKQRPVGASPLASPEAQSKKTYSFYDGPPFATGLPHYGHLLAGTIKDVIPRYQTMRGHRVERRFGWDCHGLPIENLVEKEHGIKSKREIEEKGVKWFNDLCRGSVQRYTKEWRRTVERTGRWVDMDWDYRTMDPDYMESIWWVFKQLYEKGLIYEGHKPMHICPRCATPLSNFEVSSSYSDRTDQSVIATFPLRDDPKTVLLAWTTTPWSLPGNFWLAVGPEIMYAKIRSLRASAPLLNSSDTRDSFEENRKGGASREANDDVTYVLAEKLVEKVFQGREYEIVGSIQAKDLLGKRYEPLFPYFIDAVLPSARQSGKPQTYGERVFKVVTNPAVEVSDEEGTGIVHLTSSTGEDSNAVATAERVDVLPHIRIDGSFIDAVADFVGLNAKPFDSAQGKPQKVDPMATDKKIIDYLKKAGRCFSSYTITHSYPHCWRCETPLLPYTTSSWFVAVEKIKKALLAANAETHWVPEHIRDGRFGKWLEGARDWAISRNRYWGTPIPIWRSAPNGENFQIPDSNFQTSGSNIVVIGSRDELMERVPGRFTKITVLRHGQSEGNITQIYQGEEPGTELTELGRKQAEKAGDWIAEVRGASTRPRDVMLSLSKHVASPTQHDVLLRPSTIYSSPLTRTQQTAEIISGHTGAKVMTDDRLREVSFGHFEGKHVDFSDLAYVRARREHKFGTGRPESIYHLAGMETWEEVGARIDTFLHETLAKHKGEHIVIVTHADPLQNIRHFFTGEDPFKLSHQPYPAFAKPYTFYFDHETGKQLDLHKETVDEIVWGSSSDSGLALRDAPPRHGEPVEPRGGAPQGDIYRRIPEVLDCWFESGSMPYAAAHFPFAAAQLTIDNEQLTREQPQSTVKSQSVAARPRRDGRSTVGNPPGFPADFIAEGLDQTRGWFYTLMVLSTALFGKPAFKHCIVNGIVLAPDGKKMSKRLKNYPEPDAVMEKYGADAMRFTLMASPAVRGEDLRFSEKAVEETVRRVLLPLWNAYSFFVTYANAAGWEPQKGARNLFERVPGTFLHPLDAWILAEVQDLVNRMTAQLDRYDLSATCSELHKTIDHLTDWYVRRSRRRFAGKVTAGNSKSQVPNSKQIPSSKFQNINSDQESAFSTLHSVLITISKLLAPFCPFITEAIYLNLAGAEPARPASTDLSGWPSRSDGHDSVHLMDWPQVRELTKEEENLMKRTRLLRHIVSLGMRLRAEKNIKVRQPLMSCTIALPSGSSALSKEDLVILQEELNVKECRVMEGHSSLAERAVTVHARILGPRVGAKVQEIIRAAKAGEFLEHPDGTVTILGERLSPEEATLTFAGKEGGNVAAERGVIVALDTSMTSDLALEGQARDLIRAVQKLRKDAGMTVDQMAAIQIEGADALLRVHGDRILAETKAKLAPRLRSGSSRKNVRAEATVELAGATVTVSLL